MTPKDINVELVKTLDIINSSFIDENKSKEVSTYSQLKAVGMAEDLALKISKLNE